MHCMKWLVIGNPVDDVDDFGNVVVWLQLLLQVEQPPYEICYNDEHGWLCFWWKSWWLCLGMVTIMLFDCSTPDNDLVVDVDVYDNVDVDVVVWLKHPWFWFWYLQCWCWYLWCLRKCWCWRCWFCCLIAADCLIVCFQHPRCEVNAHDKDGNTASQHARSLQWWCIQV